MVQMFGPQWTEKFGAKNEVWEKALDELTYPQISAGLSKVMHGALKFYEIDLPRFLELCKPPRAPMSLGETPRMKWAEGMSEDELQMHYFANMKLIVWSARHKRFGLNGTDNFTKQQNKALFETAHRLAHDFFMMREELGKDNVPDSDLLIALHKAWARIADATGAP